MRGDDACLKCPECGGPMTPGEKRDIGCCQYCEDAAVEKPVTTATGGHIKVRLYTALLEMQQGVRKVRRALREPREGA